MSVKFGPAGMGPVKDVEETFKRYNEYGIKACEIPFTYQVYIKKKEDALRVKKAAKKFGISLSIHAPYWVNLNSDDKEKLEGSMKRVLDSCEKAQWLGVKKVIFHCGFYGKDSKEKTFMQIKEGIKNMQEIIKENKWDVTLCPEIMGKKNVFGSIEEISGLVKETGCGFCIDFAHILARYDTYNFSLIKKQFHQENWHCHFSGIEYGNKGEKHHKKTPEKEWKKVISNLPKNKNIIIINESPSPVEDTISGLKLSSIIHSN